MTAVVSTSTGLDDLGDVGDLAADLAPERGTPLPRSGASASPPAPTLTDARSIAPRTRRPVVPRGVRRLGGPLAVVTVWYLLCATGVLDERTMAPPGDVVTAARDLLRTGELQHHLLTSLGRVVQGLSLGILAGVSFATIAGLFRLGDDLLDSTLQMLRSVPTIGMLPLIMIWFGIGEEPKVLLVAVGTMFPIYINTLAAIRGVDAKLVEAGRTFGLSRLGLARRVILPGAVPGFLVGLRFALVGAWLILIFAEQINARSGLGFLLTLGRSTYRIDIILLALAIYGMLGFTADAIVRFLERTLLAWRRGFTGT